MHVNYGHAIVAFVGCPPRAHDDWAWVKKDLWAEQKTPGIVVAIGLGDGTYRAAKVLAVDATTDEIRAAVGEARARLKAGCLR